MAERPSLSIAICTKDRPASLTACVRSVLQQTVRPAELLVIDDGTLDAGLCATLQNECSTRGVAWRYFRKSKPGLTASRNLAVQQSAGDIVQFLDDDVILQPDFCEQILRLYAADTTQCVAGIDATPIVERSANTGEVLFGALYRLAGWWSLRPRGVRRAPLPAALRDRRWAVPIWHVSGAAMSYRRRWLEGRSFDEGLSGYGLGEDREMSCQLARHGWILRSRAAQYVHRHDPHSRPDPFAFGRMTVLNYVRIMHRLGRTQLGDQLAIACTLMILASGLAVFSLLRPRRYLPEWLGMIAGAASLLRGYLMLDAESNRHTASNSLAPSQRTTDSSFSSATRHTSHVNA